METGAAVDVTRRDNHDAASDTQSLRQRQQQVAETFGAWTTPLRLADDVYTISDPDLIRHGAIRVQRMLTIVSDLSGRPLAGLRIADLGCLEGAFAAEFARHGASVLGLEGRKQNLAKADFARDVLGLRTLTLVQDDVRNFAAHRYGHFDVVLCLGLLYHLTTPDVFEVLENTSQSCERILIIDTHIASHPETYFTYKDRRYWGAYWHEDEHSQEPADVVDPAASEEPPDQLTAAKISSRPVWSSLGNPDSFLFTRTSLYNILSYLGFSSVYECHMPVEVERPKWFDRITVVAVKGPGTRAILLPSIRTLWREESGQRRRAGIAEQARRGLVAVVKRIPPEATGAVRKLLPEPVRGTVAQWLDEPITTAAPRGAPPR